MKENSGCKTTVLFLGGVFARENEAEVIAQSKNGVEFSANQMQIKLIEGLRDKIEIKVISAPFVGSYPNRSGIFWFHGFDVSQESYSYVSFCNLWGFRNLSRSFSLKRALRGFISCKNTNKLIIVYSVHDPFLSAASYAKRKDPAIKICLIAPDLPQYMNLEEKQSYCYKFFKRIDIYSIKNHLKNIDSAVVLTNEMVKALKLEGIPHMVQEGVITEISNAYLKARGIVNEDKVVKIVYTGKLYDRFGIKNLIDAFMTIKKSNYRLILCGDGDAVGYALEKSIFDKRILYMGQVSPSKAQEYISDATVLVNPRPNNEEYTRYSFPSKTIEYLLSGNPVVAYKLNGMPENYRNFIFEVDEDIEPIEALSVSIKKAVRASDEECRRKYESFYQYAKEHLLASKVGEKILALNEVYIGIA